VNCVAGPNRGHRPRVSVCVSCIDCARRWRERKSERESDKEGEEAGREGRGRVVAAFREAVCVCCGVKVCVESGERGTGAQRGETVLGVCVSVA